MSESTGNPLLDYFSPEKRKERQLADAEQRAKDAARDAAIEARGYWTHLPLLLAACKRCGCIVAKFSDTLDIHDRWHDEHP